MIVKKIFMLLTLPSKENNVKTSEKGGILAFLNKMRSYDVNAFNAEK